MSRFAREWAALSVAQKVLRLGIVALLLTVQYLYFSTVDATTGLILANTLVNPTWVMKEIARRLVNNWVFANNVSRDYDDDYVVDGAKVGDTVKARMPQRYQVTKGQQLVKTAVEDRTRDITLTDQAHVGIEFSSASLAMHVDMYRERYIAPAVDALVNTVDFDGLDRMYKATFMSVGTPAVVPGSTGTLPFAANQVYGAAKVKLDEGAVPPGGRVAVLSSNMHMYLATAQALVFNPGEQVSKFFKTGQFGGKALGADKWFMDQNVATHTVGALGSTPLIAGANQTGSSLTGDGAGGTVTGYFKKGDVIQLAGVYSINPLNYQSTGRLQDFVVTSDVDAAAGALTIPIYPSLTISGNYQTVTGSPADNAAITTFGHASSYAGLQTPQGLMYHPDAYALVMADLPLPGGIWVSERISNKELGISVRFLKDYSIESDASPARVDLLYGWAAVRPELACRISS